MKRLITISIPQSKASSQILQGVVASDNPYLGVEAIRAHWRSLPPVAVSSYETFPIGSVLPIHNPSGLRDPNQLEGMTEQIQKETDIFEEDGLPNVKLAVVPGEKLLLFDGHHTLLAYYRQGKRQLSEVPYLVVGSVEGESLTVKEISWFFPESSRGLVEKNWQKYVVNWQADNQHQLETREVQSLAELAAAFR